MFRPPYLKTAVPDRPSKTYPSTTKEYPTRNTQLFWPIWTDCGSPEAFTTFYIWGPSDRPCGRALYPIFSCSIFLVMMHYDTLEVPHIRNLNFCLSSKHDDGRLLLLCAILLLYLLIIYLVDRLLCRWLCACFQCRCGCMGFVRGDICVATCGSSSRILDKWLLLLCASHWPGAQ